MTIKKIKKGDTIGILCPSGAADMTSPRLLAMQNILTSWGYNLKFAPSCYASDGYLAGPDELRKNDIEEMFQDPTIAAIICLKGGYGASRIIDRIDFKIIKNNPKLFMGFSDITVLLNNFYSKASLPTIHGQVGSFIGSPAQDDFSLNDLKLILKENTLGRVLYHPAQTLVAGTTVGTIVGGNLSLITNLVGTPFALDFKEKIVFMEEINEAPYRVDRMLTQLRLAGKLAEAKGFVLGYFTDCDDNKKRTCDYLCEEFFKPLGKPTIMHFASGHEFPFINLPIGLKVELNATKQTITILEELYEES